MTQPPPPPPGNYPPPPPPGNYPPPPPGNYPPPPPPGAGVLPKEAYTPWIKRVGAWIVDGIPPGILVGVGEGLALATGENNCTSSSLDNNYGVSCTSQPSALGMILLFVFAVAAVVFVFWNLYRQGKTGSTIGKSVLKFKVVSEKTGQPIGFGMSIVRQLAHVVDTLICYIGYLFPLWDAKRQTIADKIMSTICVPL